MLVVTKPMQFEANSYTAPDSIEDVGTSSLGDYHMW